jgi:hypothetical protein
MSKRWVVYVAHPLGSGPDREANRKAAAGYCAKIAELGYAPVADWIILSGEWDESKRELGLACDFALIERCHALWMVGPRVSPGMALERGHAERCGVPVLDFTGDRWAFAEEHHDLRKEERS